MIILQHTWVPLYSYRLSIIPSRYFCAGISLHPEGILLYTHLLQQYSLIMKVYFCTPPSYSVFPSPYMEFSSACFLQWYLFIVKVYCCMHSGYSNNPSLCVLFTVQIPCTAIFLHYTHISLYRYLIHLFLFMQAENCRTRPPRSSLSTWNFVHATGICRHVLSRADGR